MALAALVMSSHALHDGFEVLRWEDGGIGPGAAGLLWSEGVLAEVVVFVVVGPTLLRWLRLFALLASPHSLRAMKNWAKGAAATLGLPIDSAPIQAGQPIYTGRPIFEGMEDPVPRALHARVLDGDHDTVALVVDQFALTLAASEAKIDRAVRGRNWRALLDVTVGGDEDFFVPLTRGIGVAVRSGAHPNEIEATVATLLALRADPGRQAQYGRPWVMRTIDSFRLRDDVMRGAHKRALSRLFIEATPAP
jgi:hypothetical protein